MSLLLETKVKNSVLSSKNSIRNYVSITNEDDIKSCETAEKNIYIIPTTSIPNHCAQRISATSASVLNLHTTTILTPVDKK